MFWLAQPNMRGKLKNIQKTVQVVIAAFLEAVFPSKCIVCQEVLPFGSSHVHCEPCGSELKVISSNVCQCCGKPVERDKHLCHDCSERKHSYLQGCAVWIYEGVICDLIYQFKTKDALYLGNYFADQLANKFGLQKWPQIDMICSVPLHPLKLRQRHYNQSGILADELGKRLHIPVNNRLLRRVKYTKGQKALSDFDRVNNVQAAFIANIEGNWQGIRVLIVDDVYTTGNTMDACASALKARGVQEIYFMTLAIGKGV